MGAIVFKYIFKRSNAIVLILDAAASQTVKSVDFIFTYGKSPAINLTHIRI